jgi:hypothetical protein
MPLCCRGWLNSAALCKKPWLLRSGAEQLLNVLLPAELLNVPCACSGRCC